MLRRASSLRLEQVSLSRLTGRLLQMISKVRLCAPSCGERRTERAFYETQKHQIPRASSKKTRRNLKNPRESLQKNQTPPKKPSRAVLAFLENLRESFQKNQARPKKPNFFSPRLHDDRETAEGTEKASGTPFLDLYVLATLREDFFVGRLSDRLTRLQHAKAPRRKGFRLIVFRRHWNAELPSPLDRGRPG
jgi:hypothetical protein